MVSERPWVGLGRRRSLRDSEVVKTHEEALEEEQRAQEEESAPDETTPDETPKEELPEDEAEDELPEPLGGGLEHLRR